jgi:hypothetical protein
MAPNATSTLQATIIMADANGAIPVNRGFGNPSFGGNVGDMTTNQILSNGANVITLPISGTVTGMSCIYVKNNAAPGGGTVTVQTNLNGTGLVTVAVLQPGGIYCVWNVVVPPVNASQYTQLTLQASVANVPVEYYFGG